MLFLYGILQPGLSGALFCIGKGVAKKRERKTDKAAPILLINFKMR